MPNPTACICGKPIVQSTTGGRRKYCDDCMPTDCKRSRSRHLAIAARQATTPQTCQRCSTTFYGRKRKYCGTCSVPHSKKRLPQPCEVCGEPFLRRSGRDRNGLVQRTCSRACGLQIRSDRTLQGEASDVIWASCVCCGIEFIARTRRIHCKPEPIARQLRSGTCRECGSEFISGDGMGRPRTAFCSKRCCRTADRRHRRHLARAALATQRSTAAVTPSAMTATPAPRTHCAECGDQLTGKQIRWCSKRCLRRARDRYEEHVGRAALVAGTSTQNVPVFTTREIAERDGWRCHLCKRKVSTAKASMDHLVPISDGGQHQPQNVALAHLSCNEHRGAGGSAQLRLGA